MFSDKKFGLPQGLIDAVIKVQEGDVYQFPTGKKIINNDKESVPVKKVVDKKARIKQLSAALDTPGSMKEDMSPGALSFIRQFADHMGKQKGKAAGFKPTAPTQHAPDVSKAVKAHHDMHHPAVKSKSGAGAVAAAAAAMAPTGTKSAPAKPKGNVGAAAMAAAAAAAPPTAKVSAPSKAASAPTATPKAKSKPTSDESTPVKPTPTAGVKDKYGIVRQPAAAKAIGASVLNPKKEKEVKYTATTASTGRTEFGAKAKPSSVDLSGAKEVTPQENKERRVAKGEEKRGKFGIVTNKAPLPVTGTSKLEAGDAPVVKTKKAAAKTKKVANLTGEKSAATTGVAPGKSNRTTKDGKVIQQQMSMFDPTTPGEYRLSHPKISQMKPSSQDDHVESLPHEEKSKIVRNIATEPVRKANAMANFVKDRWAKGKGTNITSKGKASVESQPSMLQQNEPSQETLDRNAEAGKFTPIEAPKHQMPIKVIQQNREMDGEKPKVIRKPREASAGKIKEPKKKIKDDVQFSPTELAHFKSIMGE